MTARLTGMVKWFNNKAGFGFLTVCGNGEYSGKDIFVHYSNIREANPAQKQYKYLVLGEYVEFVMVKSESEKHEYHATDITGILEGAIMCETRRLAIAAQSDRKAVQYNEMDAAPVDYDVVEVQRPVGRQSARPAPGASGDLPKKSVAKRPYKPRKQVSEQA
jgi:cold shock CspA family protein